MQLADIFLASDCKQHMNMIECMCVEDLRDSREQMQFFNLHEGHS